MHTADAVPVGNWLRDGISVIWATQLDVFTIEMTHVRFPFHSYVVKFVAFVLSRAANRKLLHNAQTEACVVVQGHSNGLSVLCTVVRRCTRCEISSLFSPRDRTYRTFMLFIKTPLLGNLGISSSSLLVTRVKRSNSWTRGDVAATAARTCLSWGL